MHVFVMKTGLFGDTPTLVQAIERLRVEPGTVQFDATLSDLTDADWDRALEQLLDADRVITL